MRSASPDHRNSGGDVSGDVLSQQIAIYGQPLATRFARLTTAYRISQARLAQVIGLSAPMLSQLASGQRVKISNPGVYARLLRLEELAESAPVRAGDPAHLQAALDDVAASHPQLTTGHVAEGREAAIDHLARIATAADLTGAAAVVRSEALAAVLREAAGRAAPVG
jgi:transcriptional regulator with XRE-family HTH domain